MTNFEAAVELSLNKWVASLPTDFALPEPTESYKQGTAKLIDKMRGDRYHKFTRSTARAILIAAIIMAIATAALAATVGKEFIVQQFEKYSTYSVVDASNVEEVEDISIGYIPEGFEYADSIITDDFRLLSYERKNDWINICKSKIFDQPKFETEHKNYEIIKVNRYDAVLFENPKSNYIGLIYNNGKHVFTLEGNISKDELIRVAENIT